MAELLLEIRRRKIDATDRAGLERPIRYCARPPFALDRLLLLDGRSDQILYLLPGPDLSGRTALRLSALELLDRLAKILPPPRIHRHRYHGVFAPNAPLRPLVTARMAEGLRFGNPEVLPIGHPAVAKSADLLGMLTP